MSDAGTLSDVEAKESSESLLAESPLAVRARAWLEWEGQSILGKGRLQLLAHIEAEGSISAAARAMGVSYRAAWRWVEQMNAAAARPVVLTSTGGKGGGGATLTPLGRFWLASARKVEARLAIFCREASADLGRALAEIEAATDMSGSDDAAGEGADAGDFSEARHDG